MRLMRGISVAAFGGPDVLRITTTPVLTPGPGEILVKVMAAGVNPVETYIRSGTYARLPQLPYTPGSDGAGTVAAVGPDVPLECVCYVGDRVFLTGSISGTYAEFTISHHLDVHPLPDNVSFPQGAALSIPYRTAYRALFQKARARPGQWLLIHGGTGAVGLAALQMARAAGLRVLATAGTQEGEQLLVAHGAHHVLNHRVEGYLAQVLPLTGGHGVDVVLEMLANVNLGRDLELLAHGAVVVVVGSRGAVTINPRELMMREATVVGVMAGTVSAADMRETYAYIAAGLRCGTLAPVVDETVYALADAARAHEDVMTHTTGAAGKIIVLPWA